MPSGIFKSGATFTSAQANSDVAVVDANYAAQHRIKTAPTCPRTEELPGRYPETASARPASAQLR